MKVDLLNIIYTVVMVILAFFAAIVVTKTVSKFFKLDEKKEKDQKKTK